MARPVVRAFALAVVAVVALSAGYGPVARAETQAELHAQAHVSAAVDLPKLFDAVVETIEQRFVDVETLKRIDWQARAQAVRSSVLSAGSEKDAVALINGLIAELDTSHTALFTPDDDRYYITLDAISGAPGTADLIAERFWGSGPYLPGIGVFTANVGDKHFIDGVLEGSPAARSGLQYGDEIVAVDGKPYFPIAPFRGKIGTVVDVEIRRARDAEPRHHAIAVIPIVPSAAFSDALKASARVIERNGRRIGYIHLWAITESRGFRRALAALNPDEPADVADRGKGLDALIIDLRGRVGGSMGTASHILDMLGSASKPYWGAWRALDRSGNDTAQGTDAAIARAASSSVRPFQGRSAILIDHQTRSAGEILAYGYKRSGFGAVFGTQTAGAVTGGAPFAMPGGFMLYVAATLLEFEGKRLEGVGVTPDHRVERPLPYAAGADPVLEAAVEHLARDETR